MKGAVCFYIIEILEFIMVIMFVMAFNLTLYS